MLGQLWVVLLAISPAAAVAATRSGTASSTKVSSAEAQSSTAESSSDDLQFWWSFQAENTTESYDPVFEICGDSCGDCWEGAKSCFAKEFSNICFEPKLGETCCKDKYGTSCAKDFYCAYTDDDVALCCKEGEDVRDCGKLLQETLNTATRGAPSSTTVTAIFTPSMTASDQSVVARPERTAPPSIPGSKSGTKKTDLEDIEADKDVSMAVKVGAIIGGVVGAAILITLAVMLFLHLRNKRRYNKVGDGHAEEKLLPIHPAPLPSHPMPRPVSGAPSAFEPMRNINDHRMSSAASPQSHGGPSPASFPVVAYSDHPTPPPAHQLTHAPPPN